jgi:UDP-N-acetylmuramoyl-L-alanyl-D-glutamate--2,6-diaminopimelate ligase
MSHESEATMTLAELQSSGIGGQLVGSAVQRVRGVQHDSRSVVDGDLFVAVAGLTYDATQFVDDALARGAVAVMSERPVERDVPQLIVEDARLGLGLAAELVYGRPTSRLHTIGITGTNGKTTTAYLLKQAIENTSGTAALIGTTGLFVGATEVASMHTTPEGDDISRFARRALEAGATHLVLEVSSHGLAMRRVDAVDLEVAAFTNLSRDHLDFHSTLERYGDAKARLFTELRPKQAVVHVDDPFGAEIAKRANMPVIRCSRRPESGAEIVATEWSATRAGIDAKIDTPRGSIRLRSPLLGEHNLENLLVALGCIHALGLDLNAAAQAWRNASGSPGRLERIAHPRDVAVLVDYAHTPDALRRVLDAMREVTPGRLIVVFGAGGDRDRGKRPQMGRIAAETADLCVLTSDNPRNESPQDILDEIEAGARDAGLPRCRPEELIATERGYCCVLDRRDAIKIAIRSAGDGDTVLLAGKGHETYQVIGNERFPFDDRLEAQVAIAELHGAP